MAIFKAFVRGHLAAPLLPSPVLNTLNFSSAPDIIHANDQGSSSAPPQDVDSDQGPSFKTLETLPPVSPSPSPGPWPASRGSIGCSY